MSFLANVFNQSWQVGPLAINEGTMLVSWLVMLILVVLGLVAGRQVSVENPRGLQNAFEAIFDFVGGFIESSGGEQSWVIWELLVTMILFLAFANWIGLVPGLHSPTANLSVTLGMALLVFLLTIYHGVRVHGIGGWLLHFFKPQAWLFPINLIEELAKPITLSMRLFGNIFAGEVLIDTLLKLMPLRTYPFLITVAVQVVWLGFSVFVGAIQAFIFMMLSLIYVSTSMAHEH